MKVRAYIATTDYDRILEILRCEEWRKFYEEKKDYYYTALKNSETFVYEDCDGKILGFIRALSDFSYTTFVCEIIVDSSYRNKGVARALMEKVERLAPYGTTEIISDCDAFLEACGYTKESIAMKKRGKD